LHVSTAALAPLQADKPPSPQLREPKQPADPHAVASFWLLALSLQPHSTWVFPSALSFTHCCTALPEVLWVDRQP
jgi:hypothetical protein